MKLADHLSRAESDASKVVQHARQIDIMLIEDAHDASLLSYLLKTLSSFEIAKAKSAISLTQLLMHQETPSLIIINFDCSSFDPFEMLRKFKSMASTQDIPIALISQKESTDERIQAYKLGCDDFISLPMREEEFKVRVSSKLTKQQRHFRIEQLAYLDELTQLCNRRAYNKKVSDEWARCRRLKSRMTMMLVDVDNFKKFNDQFGHHMGDQLLKFTAEILKSVCHRRTDHIARYGGDEFVVLLPDTKFEQSVTLAQRIIRQFKLKLDKTLNISSHDVTTLSVGVSSVVPNSTNSAMDLFNKADTALYQAKSLGKSCWQGTPD